VKAAPPKPAGQDATSELVRDLALRDAELADARREQRRLQDELSRAATVRGDLDRATRQLARANSTIKHLLAAQTRLAAEQRQGTPGAPRGDEPVASLILLCERIIDAQEQRARVLETIARDGADDESIARAESLARDIEVLMAALHGCPTQPHRVA
jgi:hypothetical protein